MRVAADLTLLTSVAVRRAIVQETGLPVQIKWPNDLLLHGKKICGILAEIRADGETLQHAVIGVGLNSNIPAAAFPHALTDYATSLAAYSDQPISNLQLAGRLFSELEQLFQGLILHGQGFGHVLDEWRAASATLGRRVRVQTPQGLVEGVATDINAGGILYVRQDNGLVVPIHSGDVLF
ncbi:hypothetical protein GCM10025857_00770 [Alicyclobacillus contaminans]|nr:hypothetical protein GCM10025857_00770 [Alicyclobacillus contaminans]